MVLFDQRVDMYSPPISTDTIIRGQSTDKHLQPHIISYYSIRINDQLTQRDEMARIPAVNQRLVRASDSKPQVKRPFERTSERLVETISGDTWSTLACNDCNPWSLCSILFQPWIFCHLPGDFVPFDASNLKVLTYNSIITYSDQWSLTSIVFSGLQCMLLSGSQCFRDWWNTMRSRANDSRMRDCMLPERST